MQKRVAFVVGHESWGKSQTLLALTNQKPNERRILIDSIEFHIRRMSNDDDSDGYVDFMRDIDPNEKPNLIATFCPNFRQRNAKTSFILSILREKGYRLFFWVIEHKYGKSDRVEAWEINKLGEYGTVEVFSQKEESSERAKEFRAFISNVVLAGTEIYDGTCDEMGYGSYPMILCIETREGIDFRGILYWPELNNSITEIKGRQCSQDINWEEYALLRGKDIVIPGYYQAKITGNSMKGTWKSSESAAPWK